MTWKPRRRVRIALAALLGTAALSLWVRLGPLPAGLLDPRSAGVSTMVVDRNGELLYESRSRTGMRGLPIAPDRIPRFVRAATLAAEDRRFQTHWGVDPRAVARAAWANLKAGGVVEGGSTITQQVVSLLEARQGRRPATTLGGKIREAVLALRVEHRLSKDEILARYLELAPYGNQVEGIARASTFYFNRAPADLTPAQAAYLAALPQQPSRFNPRRDPSRAIPRQRHILAAMQAAGALAAADARAARDERIAIERPAAESVAPHFVQRVLAALPPEAGPVVATTLDAPLQRHVAGIIRAHARALRAHNANNVAIAVLDNRSGGWLAWEGSGDYFDAAHGGAIDGVVAARQPGSALKPFTYAAAFDAGWHPGRVLPDVPSEFPTAEPGVLYRPRNYDGRYRGPLRARMALAGSENVPAVALASAIGVPAVAGVLRSAGISTLDKTAAHYGLGLTLGNAEVRLDELVAAYAMLARGGAFLQPSFLKNAPAPPADAQVVSPRAAYWITDILSDRDARAYVFGEGSSLDFPFAVAAKTGTSQAYHDNWTIGYTRDVTVGVWVGNFDRMPLRQSSGVTGAGPIFHDVMLAAVERVRGTLPLFDPAALAGPTADLVEVSICSLSGMKAGAACPIRTREHLRSTDATDDCNWHHASDRGVVTVYPETYRPWLRQQPGYSPVAHAPVRLKADTTTAGIVVPGFRRTTNLSIASPSDGTVFLIDPTLRPEFQAVQLRAAGALGRVEWFVNDRPVGAVLGDAPLRWPLAAGRHTLRARDADGHAATASIVVK
jgi:penicillin-binding protein 1C